MGEIAELSRAAANPSEIPSLSPILSLGDLPYRSTTLHEWDLPEVAGSRKTEFKSGDILFAKLDPGSHKAVWAPIDGFCSTDILAFRATESQFASLILSIASSDHFVAVAAKTANGTTHIRVSPDVLLNYPVLLPPAAILDEFDRVVSPMVRLCSHLATTNRCLREARNLLLPRLVSGDLDISDLDLSLEAVG
jgi:type I restriction enzyme S subunit